MAQEPSPSPWWRRAVRIGIISFFLAVFVSWTSQMALAGLPAAIAFFVVLLLIVSGVLFDVIGTSVTAADRMPLNAMAAKRVNGAKQALWLVKNADLVANFCNDVVGDVTGAVAGAAGTTVAIQLAGLLNGGSLVDQLILLSAMGMVAGLTVGGKAAGKTYAITRATEVVHLAGRALYGLERIMGRSLTGGRNSNSSKRRNS